MNISKSIPFFGKRLKEIIAVIAGYGVYAVLLILFVGLSSVVSPELMQATQTGKFFAFAYLLCAASVLFLIHKLFVAPSFTFKFTPIDLTLGLLFIYITINRFMLQEAWGLSLRYYELLGLGALYIILRQVDRSIYVWLFIAVIISGCIQAIYGNLQLYGFYPSHHSGFQMTGSFFNPGPYGGFLAVVFPVALGVYLLRHSLLKVQGSKLRVRDLVTSFLYKRNATSIEIDSNSLKNILLRILSLAGVFSILMVLPASQSRAAWLAAAISGGYLIAVKYQWIDRFKHRLNTYTKRISVMVLAGLMVLGVGYGLYTFKPDSADGRMLIWNVSSTMVMDSPWVGHGFDRFKALYMNYQAAYFQENLESETAGLADNVYYAFNEPLQFVIENGAVGIVMLLALVLSIFAASDGRHKPLLDIAKAGLLSIIVFSLFSYPMQILPIKVIGVLLMATVATFQTSLSWRFQYNVGPGLSWFRGICVSAAVVAIIATTIAISSLKEAYEEWSTAYNLYQMGAYSQSLAIYEKVETVLDSEGDFLMHYGKALSMAGEHEKAITMLERAEDYLNTTIIQTALGDSYKALGRYEKAEAAYFQAWYMAPGRFYPKYLLAKLYDENDQREKAVETAQELMEKEVKVTSMAIEEIRREMEIIINKGPS